MERRNIVMTGMPGSGKSTIGQQLAARIGYSFLDADRYLEEKEGKTLRQIIDEVGDERFLKIENARLHELNLNRYVISPGGSAIFCDDAMAHLKKSSVIVFLDAPLELIRSRLDDRDPLVVVGIRTKSIDDIYALRLPLYKKWADMTIKTDNKSGTQIVEEIIKRLDFK